jgi:hypothetical protein
MKMKTKVRIILIPMLMLLLIVCIIYLIHSVDKHSYRSYGYYYNFEVWVLENQMKMMEGIDPETGIKVRIVDKGENR